MIALRNFVRKHWIKLVLVYTLVALFFTPFGDVVDRATANAPWALAALVTSEALFNIGLVIVAIAVGSKIRNPFKLRSGDWKKIFLSSTTTPLFWVGFWINVVGALGDAVVIALAIGATLPVQSWGLLLLPAWDFFATIALRRWIIHNVRTGGGKKD